MDFLIYNINELTDSEYEKWFSLMETEKQNRVEALKFSQDKKQIVCGEMLARTMIAKRQNTDYKNLTFLTGEFGKPKVNGFNINFNISHSNELVVCCVDESPIGVDIEKIKPINSKVALRFWNDNDFQYVFGCQKSVYSPKKAYDNRTLMRFFEIWTRHEAMAKCSGLGLNNHDFRTKYKITTLYYDDYIISIAKKDDA